MNSEAQYRRPFLEEPRPQPAINRFLDHLAGPHDELFGCQAPAYFVLGVCGITVGFAVLAGLCLYVGLPLSTAVVLTVASLTVFVMVSLVRKAIVRSERHVLLQDVLLVLGAGGVVAWGLGLPVLPCLDLHILALGCFLVFGRLGCLVTGCCHGRPCALGIRYARDDALAGVRLFPVQLAEALWLLLVTLVGSLFVLARAAPGTAAAFWLAAYSAGRFVLELARGDLERPRLGPLTEAQWTFLFVILALIVREEALRPQLEVGWLCALAVTLALVALGYATRSRWLVLPEPELLAAEMEAWEGLLVQVERHAREGAGHHGATAQTPTQGVSLELVIDPGDGGNEVHAFTLRRQGGLLDERLAFALAGVILQRLPAHQVLRASFCQAGSFHVWALVAPSGPPGSTHHDEPRLLLLRAQAAARLARHVPPLAPPTPITLDPNLLPPDEGSLAPRAEPRPSTLPAPATAPTRSPFDRPFGQRASKSALIEEEP